VYLEHDYDGEEPNETYRRKVYFKDGYEYYTEDLECEQMEITAKEFEHVKEQPEAKKKRASPTFQAMHEPEREGVVRFEVGTNNDCIHNYRHYAQPRGGKICTLSNRRWGRSVPQHGVL
jgi:hypothetical protein